MSNNKLPLITQINLNGKVQSIALLEQNLTNIEKYYDKINLLYEDDKNIGIINGLDCINYSNNRINFKCRNYNSEYNLLRFDLYNNTSSGKYIYFGFRDVNFKIKTFYHCYNNHLLTDIQELKIIELIPYNRISILINLNEFENMEAYLFIYNFETPSKNIEYFNQIQYSPINYCLFSSNNKYIFDFNKLKNDIYEIIYSNPSIKEYKLSNLNSNYYNLGDLNNYSTRNMIIYSDNNDLNISEYIEDQLKIFIDLWSSKSLNLEDVLNEYNKNIDNFKPKILPECSFKIDATNDLILVEIFKNKIDYNEIDLMPLASSNIFFPQFINLNIEEWINLVNLTFSKTVIISKENGLFKLDSLLSIDWSFFPIKIQNKIIKNLIIKINNKSDYYIRISGNAKLMQLFGKNIEYLNNIEICDCNAEFKCDDCFNRENTIPNITNLTTKSKFFEKFPDKEDKEKIKDPKTKSKCRKYIENLNTVKDIHRKKQIFLFSSHNDPIVTKNDIELLINPKTIFKGVIDGIFNENINNFNILCNSTEKLYIHNLTDKLHLFHTSFCFLFFDNLEENENDKYKCLKFNKNCFEIKSNEIITCFIKYTTNSTYSLNDTKIGKFNII